MDIGIWEDKDWGRTRCLEYKSAEYSLHELELIAGGYCSFHWHKNKKNIFNVISGHVRVVWVFGWQINHIDLYAGSQHEIKSCIPHQFQVIAGGKMIEEYMPDRIHEALDLADIERITTGGCGYNFTQAVGVITTSKKLWVGQTTEL